MPRKDAEKFIILYFLAGSTATDADLAAIDAIEEADARHVVKQRNGLVVENDSLEAANGVAGPEIPTRYAKEYPHVDNAGVWSEPRTPQQQAREFLQVSGTVADEVGSAAMTPGPTNPTNPQQQTQTNTDPNLFGFSSGGNQ